MCVPYVEARPEGGARAEKEIGEKAQKIVGYQIVMRVQKKRRTFGVFRIVKSETK